MPTDHTQRLWTLSLAAALLLGVGLRVEALGSGFRTDDYVHLAMLEGRFAIERAPWDLYWFSGRDAPETVALIDSGYLPWWTHEDHRVAMLRPLSSLLIALDHALFDRNAVAYHVHSLLWLVGLLLATGALLRRILPVGVAALALVLYALDEAHGVPSAWIANRSTLVATTFGVLALSAHLRARERGPTGGWLAPLWLALCLGAGEYGLCMAAYLLAYEMFGRTEALGARLRALVPAATLCLGYLGARAALGHGARASGFYLSPLDSPLEWLSRGLPRMAALAGDLTLALPAAHWHAGAPLRAELLSLGLFDPPTWRRLPDWHTWQAAAGALGIALAALALRWLARRDPEQRRTRLWLAIGSLGALLVPAGSLPGSRLLAAGALGASILIASLLWLGFQRMRELTPARRVLPAALLIALVLAHGLNSGQHALARAGAHRARAEAERTQAARAPLPASGHALLVSASDVATAAHLPVIRQAKAPSASLLRLSGGLLPHDILRAGPRAIELRILGSDLSDSFAGSAYRPRSAPFHPGQKLECSGIRITVLDVHEGNPRHLRFDFDRPLEELTLLHAGSEGLVPIFLPADGSVRRLPRATIAWSIVRAR